MGKRQGRGEETVKLVNGSLTTLGTPAPEVGAAIEVDYQQPVVNQSSCSQYTPYGSEYSFHYPHHATDFSVRSEDRSEWSKTNISGSDEEQLGIDNDPRTISWRAAGSLYRL